MAFRKKNSQSKEDKRYVTIDITKPLSPDFRSDATKPSPVPPSPPPRGAISFFPVPYPDLDVYEVMQDYITDEPGHFSVHRKDRVFILPMSGNGDWCKGFNPYYSETAGWLPKSYIAKSHKLQGFSWYHGQMTNLMVKQVHRENITSINHFFVRKSEDGTSVCTINVYNATQTFEFHIYHNSSVYYLNSKIGFSCIEQLIAHYSKNSDGLKSPLGYPIPNKWTKMKERLLKEPQSLPPTVPPPKPDKIAVSTHQAPPPDLDLFIVKQNFITDQPDQLSVHKGEKILILSRSDEGDWCYGVNISEDVGWVPSSFVDKDHSLENYSWFHGNTTRQQAEDILSDHNVNWSFLVRDSQSTRTDHSLTVFDNQKFIHYRIQRVNPKSSQCYISSDIIFENLPQLVAHHSKDSGGLIAALLFPIPSKWKRFKDKYSQEANSVVPPTAPPTKSEEAHSTSTPTVVPPQQEDPAPTATGVASSHQDDLERQRVCERVLKAKSLITIIAVIFNYLGLPRSGKTSFRRRITGEIENILKARQQGEVEQPSTGIVEDGGQVLIKPSCLEMGVIRSRIWSVIKDLGDEANMLNQFFHQIVPDVTSENEVDAKEKTDTKEESKFSTHISQPEESLPFWKRIFRRKKTKGQPKADIVSTISDTKNEKAALNTPEEADSNFDDADEDMFAIIREAMSTDQWEEVKYLLEDTILLVNNDTGGHAEFLDLQAALVQGPSFNLLFSRLVDDMDSLFKIYYTNEEGRSTDKEDSTMTVEEVLYQSLSSIACFSGAFSTDDNTPSEDAEQSQSKAMFIGTHLDMVTEEEFKAKDEHLRKKIESTEFFKKGIVEYVSEDQLMLAVNNLSGDQAEIKGIQEILEKVIEKSFLKISIPAAWLVLSLYLRKKKFRTISLKECEELAGKLGINPDELQDALWFLHHRVGVLLYYPKVEAMKDTVICQMQVVFDSASNLIRNTFTFDRVGKYVSKEFREKGQFSLNDVKKAASGHTDSLIPLEKLVMLLQHLNVLTPIPPSLSSEDGPHTPEPTYFMPCVLQSARASELKVTTSSEDPAPLMLRYECGYVPVGVFPSMITNLVSQQLEGWKLIQKGLYKNRVQFRVGENYDTLTLISRPRYFEISLSRNEDYKTPISASLCAHVRGIIQSTLNTVTSHMNYHFKMSYKFGFECPTHPGRDHLCVLASENAKLMECLDNPEDVKAVRLGKNHKVWFASDKDEPIYSSLHSNNAGCAPSLQTFDLIKWQDEAGHEHKFHLASEVSAKWKEFGLRLGMTLNDLEALEQEYHWNSRDIWNKVMDSWLAGEAECSYQPSWVGLYTLLRDLELSEVAKKLEKAVNRL